jgi:hypothetical protein
MLERRGHPGYVSDGDGAKRGRRRKPDEALLSSACCPHDTRSIRNRETPFQDKMQADEMKADGLDRLRGQMPRVLDCVAVGGEAM